MAPGDLDEGRHAVALHVDGGRSHPWHNVPGVGVAGWDGKNPPKISKKMGWKMMFFPWKLQVWYSLIHFCEVSCETSSTLSLKFCEDGGQLLRNVACQMTYRAHPDRTPLGWAWSRCSIHDPRRKIHCLHHLPSGNLTVRYWKWP